VPSRRDSRQFPTSPGTPVPGFHIPPLRGCDWALIPPLFREFTARRRPCPSQNGLSDRLVDRVAHGGSQQFAGSGFLDEGDEAKILRIFSRLKFGLNVGGKRFSLREFPYFGQLLDHPDVDQAIPSIFPTQDLRFHMVEGERHIDVGVVLAGIDFGLDVRAQSRRISGIDGDARDASGTLLLLLTSIRISKILTPQWTNHSRSL